MRVMWLIQREYTVSIAVTWKLRSCEIWRYRKSRNKRRVWSWRIWPVTHPTSPWSPKSPNSQHAYGTVRLIQTAFTCFSLAL